MFPPFHSFVQVCIWHVLYFFWVIASGIVVEEILVACGLLLATIFLLQLKSPIRQDSLAITVFQLFLLGFAYNFFSILQFFHRPNLDLLWFSLSFILPHAIGFSFWVIPNLDPGNYGRTMSICYLWCCLVSICYTDPVAFQCRCSGTIFQTLHHTLRQSYSNGGSRSESRPLDGDGWTLSASQKAYSIPKSFYPKI